MKHYLICFFLFVYCGAPALAQAPATITISVIHQNKDQVEITVTSTKLLRNGASPYVLHIGKNYFMRCKAPQNARGKMLVFYIPLTEFEKIADGESIALAYGFVAENVQATMNVKMIAKARFWPAGKLNKSIITRD